MLLTISYSESAYPTAPVEQVIATLYDHLGISVYLFTLYSYKQQFVYISQIQNCKVQTQHIRCV